MVERTLLLITYTSIRKLILGESLKKAPWKSVNFLEKFKKHLF